jgi:FlaA1/EpsC-like NDP-sugar epimerase
MIKVFSHWIHWKTIFQIALDLIFPVACVLIAVILWGVGGQENLEIVIIYSVIFAVVMVVLNGWLGLYHRAHSRTLAQTRARAVLSLYLAVPLAYSVFFLLSITNANQKLLLLSGLAALFGTLVHRVYTMHSRTGSMMQHRVLIFGAGPEAKSVGKVLKKSDPDIQIVGYYPGPADAEICVSDQLLLSRAQSLSDTAHNLNVDEIIIALERAS